MSFRTTWLLAVALVLLTALAFALIDVPLARALGGGVGASIMRPILHVLEVVTGMNVHKFFGGAVLVVAGLSAWRWRPDLGGALVVIGATNLIARLIAGLLKGPVGRLRPREALEQGRQLGELFAGGISFPSGHVAHFAGLAIPIAILWPRAAAPALAVAGFVIVARVLPNDHFLADTLASFALAAVIAAALATALRRVLRAPAREARGHRNSRSGNAAIGGAAHR